MPTTIRLAGISGSLRKQSWNTMLLKSLPALLPAGVELEMIAIAGLPLYNQDLDLPAAGDRPRAVQLFREALTACDGLVIVSPEYNYSIPGVLKNAIDWASRGEDSPIVKKPVALMGATPGMWGTVRMQQAFLPVFLYLDMQQVKPEVMVAQAPSKFDAQGQLQDEATKKIITQQLEAMKVQCSKHLKGIPF